MKSINFSVWFNDYVSCRDWNFEQIFYDLFVTIMTSMLRTRVQVKSFVHFFVVVWSNLLRKIYFHKQPTWKKTDWKHSFFLLISGCLSTFSRFSRENKFMKIIEKLLISFLLLFIISKLFFLIFFPGFSSRTQSLIVDVYLFYLYTGWFLCAFFFFSVHPKNLRCIKNMENWLINWYSWCSSAQV